MYSSNIVLQNNSNTVIMEVTLKEKKKRKKKKRGRERGGEKGGERRGNDVEKILEHRAGRELGGSSNSPPPPPPKAVFHYL